MKKITLFLLGLALTALACGLNAPATQTQPDLEAIVASTLTAVASSAAEPGALPEASGVAVNQFGVQFTIPNGLATGATGEIVPLADESTNSDPWGMAPEHISFTLVGYPAFPNAHDPVIRIYPADALAAVNPWASGSISSLRAILASPSLPINNENASTVPFLGAAAQLYAAQTERLSFQGGNGIRMISLYAQFPGWITKDGSFYHFEGLTADGKYMVAVLFPLILPLQSTADNPSADGVIYPADFGDGKAIDEYYAGITEKLNSIPNEGFQPVLTQLDLLVQSIQITGAP